MVGSVGEGTVCPAFELFNLKRSPGCKNLAETANCHLADNCKSQDDSLAERAGLYPAPDRHLAAISASELFPHGADFASAAAGRRRRGLS